MADYSSLQLKIEALKAKVEQNSITPLYLGAILDDFITQMQSIDQSSLSGNVKKALSVSMEALQTASEALNDSQNAMNFSSNAAAASVAAKDMATDALSKASAALSAATALQDSIGVPEGIAPLDSSGLIPAGHIPPALDNVKMFDGFVSGAKVSSVHLSGSVTVNFVKTTGRFVALPSKGVTASQYSNDWDGADSYGTKAANGCIPYGDKVYVDRTTNKIYRWDGSSLVAIGSDLAPGEIPREHVTVKVRGYDGTAGVSGAGHSVFLDVFNVKGYPCLSLPRQQLTCDENGIVEFDIPHGFRYAVFSKIPGLGASFQFVRTAATQKRTIELWNFPIGVKHLYSCGIQSTVNDTFRGVPFTSDHYITDWGSEATKNMLEWDCDKSPGINEKRTTCTDCGILVSTADTSFVIDGDYDGPNSGWNDDIYYRNYAPWVHCFDYTTGTNDEWEDARNRALADFDGNLNTARILDFAHSPEAANYCAFSIGEYTDQQRWLASAGQAYLMFLNYAAINALMTEFNTTTGNTRYSLLPTQNADGSWNNSRTFWTSSIASDTSVWAANPEDFFDDDATMTYLACGLSAFVFGYY